LLQGQLWLLEGEIEKVKPFASLLLQHYLGIYDESKNKEISSFLLSVVLNQVSATSGLD
jgi:hypothetical protein